MSSTATGTGLKRPRNGRRAEKGEQSRTTVSRTTSLPGTHGSNVLVFQGEVARQPRRP
jgi:hypothetical protein